MVAPPRLRASLVAGLVVLAAGVVGLAVVVPPLPYDRLRPESPVGEHGLVAGFAFSNVILVVDRRTFFVAASCVLCVLAGLFLLNRRGHFRLRALVAFGAAGLALVPTLQGLAASAQLVVSSAGALLVAAGVMILLSGREALAETLSCSVASAAGRVLRVPVRVFSVSLFVAGLVPAAIASRRLFHGIPHVIDSAAQLFQARIFASLALWAKEPAIPRFFGRVYMVLQDGRWFSMYSPGHSLVLALGVTAGVPWLVNPLLGASAAVLVYRLGAALYDEETGRIAGLLTVFSPFVLFMSSEYMNHATSLAAALASALFLVRVARGGRIRDGLALGLAGGLLFLTRPWTAVGVGVPITFSAARAFQRGDARIRRALVFAALVATGCVGLHLVFNRLTTGSPLLFGYALAGGVGPGFGKATWGEPLTLARSVQNTLSNLNALDFSLLGWPVPAFFLMALPFALGRRRSGDGLLLAASAGLVVAYALYWYQDLAFGPRFLYEAAGFLILLVARGVRELSKPGQGAGAPRSGLVVLACVGSAVWMLAVPMPLLLREYGGGYLGGTSRVVDAVKAAGLRNALVFVNTYYPSAFSQNAPGLDGPVVYARDMPHRDELIRLYPGRRVFVETEGRLSPLGPP